MDWGGFAAAAGHTGMAGSHKVHTLPAELDLFAKQGDVYKQVHCSRNFEYCIRWVCLYLSRECKLWNKLHLIFLATLRLLVGMH